MSGSVGDRPRSLRSSEELDRVEKLGLNGSRNSAGISRGLEFDRLSTEQKAQCFVFSRKEETAQSKKTEYRHAGTDGSVREDRNTVKPERRSMKIAAAGKPPQRVLSTR